MQNRRLAIMLSTLLILSIMLSGCMARPGQGELAAATATDSVVVDIPAIAITYDDQGQASLKGLDLAALGINEARHLAALDDEGIERLAASSGASREEVRAWVKQASNEVKNGK